MAHMDRDRLLPGTNEPRLEALDGVRGFSVIIVALFHYSLHPIGGYLGVDVFFVLSGFLITSVVLREGTDFNWSRARMFYIKRALRIVPALLEMLVLFSIMKLIFRAQITHFAGELLSSLFVYSNWTRSFDLGYPFYLGHTWSLAIEEQYYLIYPLFLMMVLRGRSGRWMLAAVAASLALIFCVERFILTNQHASALRLYDGTDTRIPAILIGCVAAVLIETRSVRERLSSIWLATLALAGILAMVATIDWKDPWLYRYGLGILAICSVLLIIHLHTVPGSPLSRCFAWKPLAYTGKIAYGIYLFHLPVFMCFGWIMKWPVPKTMLVGFPITLALAALSWRFVERPALQLKSRFAPAPEPVPVAVSTAHG